MNSLICLSLLFAVAAAQYKPQPIQWAYSTSDEAVKPTSWQNVSPVPQTGYWPSYYSPSSYQYAAEVPAKNWYIQKSPAVPVVARSDSSEWKVEPASWSDASYVPQSWSAGYYSAGIPAPAPVKVEKQIVAKKIVAPVVKVDQAQPIADPTPKLITYSTEITHDVPAKKEEVSSIVPTRIVAPQVAPVVSAPVQYSAWSAGEVKPVVDVKPATWTSEIKPASWAPEAKPATWTSEIKPATWTSEVKPGTWSSEVKPVGWTSEVKPASWAWSEPKPASWAAWAPEAKPASWASWSEAKPWSSYVSPVQPAFYGSWAQPAIATNAHHALSTPWPSKWSAHPMTWTEGIQKRSERKPF